MPVHIENVYAKEEVQILLEDDWELPVQVKGLEDWVLNYGKILRQGEYRATILFDIDEDSTGRDVLLSSSAIKIMAEIGMDLELTECPGTVPKGSTKALQTEE